MQGLIMDVKNALFFAAIQPAAATAASVVFIPTMATSLSFYDSSSLICALHAHLHLPIICFKYAKLIQFLVVL